MQTLLSLLLPMPSQRHHQRKGRRHQKKRQTGEEEGDLPFLMRRKLNVTQRRPQKLDVDVVGLRDPLPRKRQKLQRKSEQVCSSRWQLEESQWFATNVKRTSENRIDEDVDNVFTFVLSACRALNLPLLGV